MFKRPVAFGNVVVPGVVENERIKTVGRVVVAIVGLERTTTVGRVVVIDCVGIERIDSIRRVAAAGCVAKERLKTVGSVATARCVAKERSKTDGRVEEACCEVEERTIASAVLLLGYPPSGGGLTAHTAGENPNQTSVARIVFSRISGFIWFFLSFN